MVFSDTVQQKVSDPDYANEVFRARYGYKEEHVHAPPYRRNRDFKPVNYGSFRGILNFKHSEPFALLKNLSSLQYEQHHHLIKWFKVFLFGAFSGALLGYSWFIFRPFQSFPIRKLLQSAGERPWSGRLLRIQKHVLIPYMFAGGALTLSYQLILDFLNHHETNTDKPKIINHYIATCLLGTAIGAIYGTRPSHAITGLVGSFFILAPMSWYLYKQGRPNAQNRHSNIFYENSATPEDIQRIQALDAMETLAGTMKAQAGYGYFSKDSRFF